ncbi:MFS transporter [Roseibium sp.]|uniref:MFS transporter n=1 Tax=Roseibium sp. TaxID=1936156 RepID=UPI003A968BD1
MRAFSSPPPQGLKIIVLLILGSTCTSSLVPSMGYFIVEGLQQPAWKIGFYTGLVALMTMLANRRLGKLLDASVAPRKLLIMSICSFIVFAGLLASGPRFEVLVLVGAPLMALANGSGTTTFTFGRLYADTQDLDVGRFNALLRMGVSLAWMIGPALTFSLVSQVGFQKTYLVSALLGVLWLVSWHFAVPSNFRAEKRTRLSAQDGNGLPLALWFAIAACALFAIANILFTSVLPLYFIKQVGLPGFTPGLTLSLKCLMEIFAIFAAARLAERFGGQAVLISAAALALVVFVLMAHITTVWQAAAISLMEGLYYGLFAGIGITYIQSFIPEKPGRATAIYMNCLFLGGMLGSTSMGVIASATDYRAVVMTAAGAAGLSLVLLLFTRKGQRRPA